VPDFQEVVYGFYFSFPFSLSFTSEEASAGASAPSAAAAAAASAASSSSVFRAILDVATDTTVVIFGSSNSSLSYARSPALIE